MLIQTKLGTNRSHTVTLNYSSHGTRAHGSALSRVLSPFLCAWIDDISILYERKVADSSKRREGASAGRLVSALSVLDERRMSRGYCVPFDSVNN